MHIGGKAMAALRKHAAGCWVEGAGPQHARLVVLKVSKHGRCKPLKDGDQVGLRPRVLKHCQPASQSRCIDKEAQARGGYSFALHGAIDLDMAAEHSSCCLLGTG